MQQPWLDPRPQEQRLLNEVRTLRLLLLWWAKSSNTGLAAEYTRMRATLLEEAEDGLLDLPDFVAACPTIDALTLSSGNASQAILPPVSATSMRSCGR